MFRGSAVARNIGLAGIAGTMLLVAATKGIRDITSGAVLLAVWAAAGPEALGWALVTAAITPIGDAMIVRTNGGRLATALGIHGVTAALILTAGFVLALG